MDPLTHEAIDRAERETPKPTLASHLTPGTVLPAQTFRMLDRLVFELAGQAEVTRVEVFTRLHLSPAGEAHVPGHVDVPQGGRPLAFGLARPRRPLRIEATGDEADPYDAYLEETWEAWDRRGGYGG